MQEDLLRSSEMAALTVTQLNTLIHDLLDGCDLLRIYPFAEKYPISKSIPRGICIFP